MTDPDSGPFFFLATFLDGKEYAVHHNSLCEARALAIAARLRDGSGLNHKTTSIRCMVRCSPERGRGAFTMADVFGTYAQ